jgi:hypothetical protein
MSKLAEKAKHHLEILASHADNLRQARKQRETEIANIDAQLAEVAQQKIEWEAALSEEQKSRSKRVAANGQ